MYQVLILESAEQEIDAAAQWYNEQSSGLGRRFIASVRSKIVLIEQNPELYSIKHKNKSAAVLDVFPLLFTIQSTLSVRKY